MSNGMAMVQLPGDAHALLRPAEQVSEKLRRPLVNAQARLSSILPDTPPGATDEEKQMTFGRAVSAQPELMDEVNDLLILAFVSDWSFDAPVSRDGLLLIPSVAYDALKKECEGRKGPLLPNFEPDVKPDSPIEPSTGSEG